MERYTGAGRPAAVRRAITLRPMLMSSSDLRHVVVLGGGMAGLAAAESLANAAARAAGRLRITLVEPTGRPGGVLATVRRDGWLVERSADNFLAVRPEAVQLVERLGLAPELIGVNENVRRALIWRAGRTLPAPQGFRLLAPGRVRGILDTPLLSPWGRLRVLAERFVPRAATTADESLESFVVRRLGREGFERLVQPLAAGIWTADPARLSMAAACPEFFAMERERGSLWAGERARLAAARTGEATGARYGQFVTLAGGMETLPARLAGRLREQGVAFRRAFAGPVTRGEAGGWRIPLSGADARAAEPPSEWLEADGVVIAAPAPAAARIVAAADASLAADLAAIEYAGSAIISLGFPRAAVAHPLDAAGMVVPRCEGRRILAVSFSSSKFPGRAPEGCVLLRVFVGGALDPEAMQLTDAELEALAGDEVSRMLGARGRPLLAQVDRWQGAMPQYHVGHLDRVARIERAVAAQPGLALAGAAYRGVGIPQVIASGQAAAARLLGEPAAG